MEIPIPIVWLCLILFLTSTLIGLQIARKYYAWAFCTTIATVLIIASPVKDIIDSNIELTNCIEQLALPACRISISGLWIYHILILTLLYNKFKLSWDFKMCLDPYAPVIPTTCVDENDKYVIRRKVTISKSWCLKCFYCCYYSAIMMINCMCRSLLCCKCISMLTFLKVAGFIHLISFASFYGLQYVENIYLELFWVWIVPVYIMNLYVECKEHKSWSYKYINILFAYINFFLYVISWGILNYSGETFSVDWEYYYLLLAWIIQYWISFYYSHKYHQVPTSSSMPTTDIRNMMTKPGYIGYLIEKNATAAKKLSIQNNHLWRNRSRNGSIDPINGVKPLIDTSTSSKKNVDAFGLADNNINNITNSIDDEERYEENNIQMDILSTDTIGDPNIIKPVVLSNGLTKSTDLP